MTLQGIFILVLMKKSHKYRSAVQTVQLLCHVFRYQILDFNTTYENGPNQNKKCQINCVSLQFFAQSH